MEVVPVHGDPCCDEAGLRSVAREPGILRPNSSSEHHGVWRSRRTHPDSQVPAPLERMEKVGRRLRVGAHHVDAAGEARRHEGIMPASACEGLLQGE